MPTVPKTANKGNLPNITVEKIVRVDKGALVGFATVLVGSTFRFHSLRIIHQPGKPAWVSLPQSEVPPKTPNEKRKFFPVVEILDTNLKDAICSAVLAAYKARSEPADLKPVRASIPPAGGYAASDEDVAF
jgi:DNA-binding cell septation regulator SpoVG